MNFKVISTVLALSLSGCAVAPAIAAEPQKAPVACGKTIEECQKVVDQKDAQIKNLSTVVQGAIQQRNSVQQNLLDTQLNNYVESQTRTAAPQLTEQTKVKQ